MTAGDGMDASLLGANKEKILARVKKMMTLANDAGASEGERDNALRMAHATLAKYNLSMAEADKVGTTPEEKRLSDNMVGRDYPWMRTSAHAIAKLFFCNYFFISYGDGTVTHYFVGRESNVYTAKEMAAYVIRSIDREAQRVSKERTGKGGGTFWRSFCKGAAYQVWLRCEEIRKSAEEAPKVPGTSLVLASVYQIEDKANADFIAHQMGLKMTQSKGRQRNTSAEAHAAGREYGKKVSLNTQIGSNTSNAKRIK